MSSNNSHRNWLELANLKVLIEECSIVKEISFSLAKGETLVLMGPNGSGKSTILMTMIGSQSGQLRVPPFKFKLESININELDFSRRADFITIVPQFPEYQRGLSVRKYLTFSRFNFLEKGLGENEELLNEIIEGLSLAPLLNQNMDHLSGGELKRVAIAAALYQETSLVLFDEPFQALDPKVKKSLAEFLLKWQRDKKCSYIISSHDFYWSYKLAHKAVFLKRGEILNFGSRDDVFTTENLKTTYDTDFAWIKAESGEGFFMPLASEGEGAKS